MPSFPPSAPSTPALRRVVVTAAGIVSPLGIGLEETLGALRHSRPGITPVRLFDTEGCRSRSAGQVDETRLAPSPAASRRRHAARRHRAGAMMCAAGEELFRADPAFHPQALVIGTTSGGMSFGEAFFRTLPGGHGRRRNPGRLAHYSGQKAVLEMQEACALAGLPVQVIANACASGTNAIGHAFELIRHGVRDRVLSGGYDALSELVYVGFDSLQASSPDVCRPFDRHRNGLIMGEGAALLALEAYESARERGAPILAEVCGYGLSTDNHHLTQPHPSGIGPRQAMERALASAGLAPAAIDYINAHGTATPFNDATEGAAIEAIFGPAAVAVSSTKGLTGHALGGAGAIEAVFSLLALRHRFLPANAGLLEADPQWQLDLVTGDARPTAPATILTNSFGFGGTNASLVLRHPEAMAATEREEAAA